MYHYTLQIVIASASGQWDAVFSRVQPLERFSHQWTVSPQPDAGLLGGADLVLWDLPLPGSTEHLRAQCKQGALLIVCAPSERAAAMSPQELAVLDGLWQTPLPDPLAEFQALRLLRQVKLQKDYTLVQTYLDTAIDSIPDLVWFKDARGSHLKVNDAFCQAVGKTKDDVQGRGHYYIWDLNPEEYESGEYICLESEEIVLQSGKTCLFDEKVKSKNGMRQFKTYKSPLFDENGQVMGTVGIAHDVTDLENMGTELEIILRSMPFAVVVKNDSGTIINANETFEEYFRIPKDQVIGMDYEAWKFGALSGLSPVSNEGYAEARVAGDQGRILEIHEELIYDVFRNVAGQVCICRDITTERAMEEQILRNSNTDFLTGLYNRRYFYEYISEHRGAQPINLLYVDLDNFKQVNDMYGHQVGDEALVVTARLIRQSFPRDFIARLGGDEFLITILGPHSLDELKRQARDLLGEMAQAFQASRYFRELSASVGIAQTSDPSVKIDALIQRSDIALYQAKEQGKARFCVYGQDQWCTSGAGGMQDE